MNELLKEALSLAEGDARWLEDAAQYFEDYASQLSDAEKAKWQLLAAVYRERAHACQGLAGKARHGFATDGQSALRSENA
jgi:hypothetical protein